MKIIIIVLVLLSPYLLWADSWDNLTLKKAQQVQNLLKIDPYLLDYCDCCSFDGEYATKVYLVKVQSTKIVPCEWDNTLFSVKADIKVLAELPYLKNGPQINSPIIEKSESELLITMNYTWAYYKEERKAAPIYTVIPYEYYGEQDLKRGSCRELISFPKPKDIKDKLYKKWFKKKAKIK